MKSLKKTALLIVLALLIAGGAAYAGFAPSQDANNAVLKLLKSHKKTGEDGQPASNPATEFGNDFLGFNAYSPPADFPELIFYDRDSQPVKLSSFKGKYVVLNFWATWCAPCVEELPSLAKLSRVRDKDIAIVPVAFDFNPDMKKLAGFLERNNAADLPLYADAKGVVQRAIPTKGLPTTIILNREGQIIYIMEGGADWAGKKAITFIDFLTQSP